MPNEAAPDVGLGRLYPDLSLALGEQHCINDGAWACPLERAHRAEPETVWSQREAKPLEDPGESYFDAIIESLTSRKIKW